VAAAVVAVAVAHQAGATVLFHDDFSSDPTLGTSWNVYKDHGLPQEAAWSPAGYEVLTATTPRDLGAIMFATTDLPSTRWNASFDFWVDANPAGADGISFAFYKDDSYAISPGPDWAATLALVQRPGFTAPHSGYAVTIDSYQNGWDPGPTSLSTVNDDETQSRGHDVTPFPAAEDGRWHHMVVDDCGSALTVTVDGVLLITDPGPFSTAFRHWGLGAATGAQGHEQRIDNVTLTDCQPVVPPPTLAFTWTVQGQDCTSVAVSFAASSAPAGAITSWGWDFGDGSQGTGVAPTHSFAPGTYIVQVAGTTSTGQTVSANHTVATGSALQCPPSIQTPGMTVAMGEHGSSCATAQAGRGGRLSFHAGELPPGADFDGATGCMGWIPDRIGTWCVPITVVETPGNLSARDCMTLRSVPPAEASQDTDQDGVPDISDNCPTVANHDQTDADADGVGDACEANQSAGNSTPAKELRPSPETDTDRDGIPDRLDDCAAVPNHDQRDSDGDGLGDACDSDIDNDGVPNALDDCPSHPDSLQDCTLKPASSPPARRSPSDTASLWNVSARTLHGMGFAAIAFAAGLVVVAVVLQRRRR